MMRLAVQDVSGTPMTVADRIRDLQPAAAASTVLRADARVITWLAPLALVVQISSDLS